MSDARVLLHNQLTLTGQMEHGFRTGCLHCDRGHLHSEKAKELLAEAPDMIDRELLAEWVRRVEEAMDELIYDRAYYELCRSRTEELFGAPTHTEENGK